MLNSQDRHHLWDWLLQVAYTSGRLFVKNELQNHAGATSFYFLLSAAPMVLLVSYAAQWLENLARSSNLAAILLAAFYEQFRLAWLMEMGFIPSDVRAAAGGIGVLTLVLSSRGLVGAVQRAFRVIFPDEAKRRFVLTWILPLIVIPLVLLLVIVSVLAQGALRFLALDDLLGFGQAWLLQGASLAVSLTAVWGLIFAAYWRLPLNHPPVRQAMLLALFSTLTVMVLGTAFGIFFSVEKYRAVYGALGGVVFILIATYVTFLVFYFWAQCLYALAKVDVAALERLFLGGQADNAVERFVFGRGTRLLDKYGRSYAAGEVLIHEGDVGTEAFFLYSGGVRLYKGEGAARHSLGRLEAGELFGEMAYLLNETRTATVVADSEVVALVLPPEMLEELMRYSAPLSRRIIGALGQRLQRMNQATAAPMSGAAEAG